jgi:hypothetical protein
MDVAFVVILGTAIITTIGVSVISHMEMKKIKQNKISNSQNVDYNKIDNIIDKKNKE